MSDKDRRTDLGPVGAATAVAARARDEESGASEAAYAEWSWPKSLIFGHERATTEVAARSIL